jgi:CheY-like chemotaxis protein
LRQILINLVGNAIKFTDAGTVRLTLALDQREPVPQLSFAVMDTGIGIDEATLQRLFSPFSQGDSSTTRRFGGTGLGLSISRRLVGLLGGTLCVESEAGRGSTFLATIPTGEIGAVVTAATEVGRARRQSRPELGATPALAGRRILVVEDGEDNQRLLAVYLQREGAQVETLANGKLALERLMASDFSDGGASAFDVVLMDMQMPVMDGYTATAALRRWGYRGAIVALTAHALDSDRKRCIDAGCDDYLAKPIDRASLVSMVLGQLDGSPLTPNTQAGRRVSSNMHDDSEMGDLLRAFVASLPGRVAALTAAHRAGDMVELSTLAHQLRGAGGGYGFPTITVAAAGVETEVEAGDVDRLSSSIAQLIETCLAAEAPQKVADRSIPLRPSSESHPFISDRE